MSRQTRMIDADHSANLERRPELLLLDPIRRSSDLLASAVHEWSPTI
jgi:hypothetical protein